MAAPELSVTEPVTLPYSACAAAPAGRHNNNIIATAAREARCTRESRDVTETSGEADSINRCGGATRLAQNGSKSSKFSAVPENFLDQRGDGLEPCRATGIRVSVTKGKKVRLQDIARAAGVSGATVSRVINRTGRVSPALEARVQRIAGRMKVDLAARLKP